MQVSLITRQQKLKSENEICKESEEKWGKKESKTLKRKRADKNTGKKLTSNRYDQFTRFAIKTASVIRLHTQPLGPP